MKTYQQFKKSILKDKQVAKHYQDLELEYQIIKQVMLLRDKFSLSQRELAKKLGTTQSAIARFESGKINPTLKFLKNLAKALDSKLVISFK